MSRPSHSRPGISRFRSARASSVIALAAFGLSAAAHSDLRFSDRSDAAGVSQFALESWGAAVGDLNSDGLLDIYLTNHVKSGVMLQNNGDSTFTDVTRLTDVELLWHTTWPREVEDHTHGAVWGDYDNDGDLDIGVADERVTNIYENRDGRMYNSGLAPGRVWRLETAFIDWDQDGWLDLGLSGTPAQRDPVLQTSQGNGNFQRDSDSRIAGRECSFNNLVLSDFDVDGTMDFACGEYPNEWPQNSQFLTVGSDQTGPLPQTTQVQDVLSADFNNDLRPDLFMVRGALRPSDSVQDGANRLALHMTAANTADKTAVIQGSGELNLNVDWNRGDFGCNTSAIMYLGAGGLVADADGNRTDTLGRFEPIELRLDPADSRWHGHFNYSGCGAALGYFPSEGAWRLKVGGRGSHHLYAIAESPAPISVSEIENAGFAHGAIRPKFFLNLPTGFEDRSFAAGLAFERCASVVAGDFDNDMDLDLYLGCRAGAANLPNVLYENDGSGQFTRVLNGGAAGEVGLAAEADGTGAGNTDSVVTLDYDLDGYLDLFAINGLNLRPATVAGHYNLMHNDGSGNHWVQLDLEGTASNRDGIGARVYATTPDGTVQYREQNGGYHRWSQNQMRIHFGLARHNTVNLRIEWPSGETDLINDVAANQLYRAVEGTDAVTVRSVNAPLPYPCAEPTLDAAAESGLYLWQNCIQKVWNVRLLSHERTERFTGQLRLDSGAVTDLTPNRVEPDDQVTQINARAIDFALTVNAGTQDGFTFRLDGAAGACFDFQSYAGNVFYLGSEKRPAAVNGGLALDPIAICPGLLGPDADGDGTPNSDDAFPNEPAEDRDRDGDGIGDNSDPFPDDPGNGAPAAVTCGEPTINNSTDRALFLWQDCFGPAQDWHIRATGGGATRAFVAAGVLTPATGISNLTPIGLEAADQLGPNNGDLTFALRLFGTGVDGFNFNAAADVCFVPNPSDLPVYLGANRTPLTTTGIRLDNSGTCAAAPSPDSDGDGLTDAEEIGLGTDPNNPDTDGERLSDGDEVNVYGTDPLRTNTDRDGLSDYAEITFFGTDPLVADTDGGGVNDGAERRNGTDPLDPSDD